MCRYMRLRNEGQSYWDRKPVSSVCRLFVCLIETVCFQERRLRSVSVFLKNSVADGWFGHGMSLWMCMIMRPSDAGPHSLAAMLVSLAQLALRSSDIFTVINVYWVYLDLPSAHSIRSQVHAPCGHELEKHSMKFSSWYEQNSWFNHERGGFCDLLLHASLRTSLSRSYHSECDNVVVGLMFSHSLWAKYSFIISFSLLRAQPLQHRKRYKHKGLAFQASILRWVVRWGRGTRPPIC